MPHLLAILNCIAGLTLLLAGLDALTHRREHFISALFWLGLGAAVIANAVRVWPV